MSGYKSFAFSNELDLLKNTQLEASAGTGKTYSIERIVALLISKSSLSISQILIVTFTKKAARELKERIREILFRSHSGGILDPGGLSLSLSIEEQENLRNAALEFEKASIFTIHGFCLNMIKAYPFESMSQFSMEMESESEITKEAVWDYMRDIGEQMDEGQLLKYRAFLDGKNFDNAVDALTKAIDGELLEPEVTVIPGKNFINEVTGSILDFNNKRGDLYASWINLYKSIPDLEYLNSLGFARAKSKILKLNILRELPEDSDFFKITRELCEGEVLKTLLQLHPDNLEKNLKKGADPDTVSEDIFVQAVETFLNFFEFDEDKIKNDIYRQTLKAAFLFEAYDKIREKAGRKKDITGKLDFNDLIGKLHRVLCGGDSSRQPQLIKEIRKRYRTVLVDEFQDTDSRQWDIFNTLFGQDREHNHFLVGDPKQSIYGFRGADLEIYYKACNCDSIDEKYTLDKNYRSVSSLVEAVNIFFSRIFHKDMHCGSTVNTPFNPVEAGKDNTGVLKDNRAVLEFIQVESAIDPKTELTKLSRGKDHFFKIIAFKIYDLLNNDLKLVNDFLKPGDIAILTENNKDCLTLQKLLSNYSIPSVITAREKIFNTLEAGEFLIFLQVLVRKNNSSVKLLLLSIFFELTPAEVDNLERSGTQDIISGQIYVWKELVDKGRIIEVCRELFNYTEIPGVALSFEKRVLMKKNGERSYTNIRQLMEYLHREQRAAKLDAEQLFLLLNSRIIGNSAGEEDLLRLDKDSEAVQIMTMHASKGLEFPVVFFAGALKKDMKSSSSNMYNFVKDKKRYYDFLKYEKNKINQSMDMWEERKRLYYVAFTRASSKLFLPFIKKSEISYLSSMYSSFCYDEINSHLVDHPQLVSFIQPIHSGLKCRKSDLKKEVIDIVDQSVETFVVNNSDYFCINDKLEKQYFQSLLNGDRMIFKENKEDVSLYFRRLENNGFAERYTKVSSYSSIIRDKNFPYHDHVDVNDQDHDDVVEKSESLPERQVLTKGAVLGELVHKIFEDLDYETVKENDFYSFVKSEVVEMLFKTNSIRFFSNKWYNKFSVQLKEVIYKTLKNPIIDEFSLSLLKNDEKIHELEFHISVNECRSFVLKKFEGFIENGFLKGYIDLVFRYNGKIYIADWKTTSTHEGEIYSKEILDDLMESHFYNLQSMIYITAICKFLIETEDSFDYERDFGGCFYFFVRGIMGKEDSEEGIHFYKPDMDQLLSFSSQFTSMEFSK